MSAELDMRYVVVERGRRSCGVRLAILEDRLWRARERDAVRNMVSTLSRLMLYPGGGRSVLVEVLKLLLGLVTENYPSVGDNSGLKFATLAFSTF